MDVLGRGSRFVTTMRALLERAERYFPANPALVPLSGGPPLTWGEFVLRIRRAAGVRRACGARSESRPETVLLSYAAMIRGKPS